MHSFGVCCVLDIQRPLLIVSNTFYRVFGAEGKKVLNIDKNSYYGGCVLPLAQGVSTTC